MYQALSPRWDRPLGPVQGLAPGALRPGPASTRVGARREPSRRAFFICFGDLPGGLPNGSEAAKIDARARAAAVFDDALAAIDGRTAVVAVMAGDVVPIARLRRRRRGCTPSGGIADDRGWLASHDLLLEWGALARVLFISREPVTPRSRAIRYIVFPECFIGTHMSG